MHGKLVIAKNFLFSINNDEECVMHSKSDNVEIMMNDKADGIKEELLDSLKGTLPGLRKFLAIESPLNDDEKCLPQKLFLFSRYLNFCLEFLVI